MWFKKKNSDDENKKKFGKEYPERAIDERGKRKIGTRRVYMGPEPQKVDAMKCVYAGPDYFAKQNKLVNDMADVYAGPEYYEQRDSAEEPEPVEDEIIEENVPEQKNIMQAPVISENNDPLMAPVYAGPGMADGVKTKKIPMGAVYAGPDRLVKAMPAAEVKKSLDRPPFEAVYAAPMPPIQTMNLVYGGPAQFNPSMMMAYAGPGMNNCFGGMVSEPQINCQKCGALIPKRSKFCLECGEKVEIIPETIVTEDGEFIRCECGENVRVGGRFCPNCGALLIKKKMDNQ